MQSNREQWFVNQVKRIQQMQLPEVERAIRESQAFVDKHPQFELDWSNEYLQALIARRASLITKRK